MLAFVEEHLKNLILEKEAILKNFSRLNAPAQEASWLDEHIGEWLEKKGKDPNFWNGEDSL